MAPSAQPGLEGSCGLAGHGQGDRFSSVGPAGGVELLQAWFEGHAFDKHRHDTYAIGVTDAGVQAFNYRGSGRVSTQGDVMVLHPDESHDGHSGAEEGFGYRMLYIEPALIGEAARTLRGRSVPLPFLEAVTRDRALTSVVEDAFSGFPSTMTELDADDIILRAAAALLEGAKEAGADQAALDLPALERARAYLDAEHDRVVRSAELEQVTGLSRYELARQFRRAYGTSPYRYLLMRRLDRARVALAGDQPLADLAAELGFADQAHFTRMFKAAFGMAPARHRALSRSAGDAAVTD